MFILLRQPFLGLTVAVLCTAYIVYQRRADFADFIKGSRLFSKQASLAIRHVADPIDTWQLAKTALLSGKFDEPTEAQLYAVIEKAAANREAGAREAIAEIAFFGSASIDPDYRHAFTLFTSLYQEEHSAKAAHMLGLYYAEGIGVAADPARALLYHTVAAKADHLPSILTLAHWNMAGLHGDSDCAAARSHLFEAAKQVDVELAKRKRKYRSVVPPDSIVEKKSRKDVLSMFPSKELIEYYRYSADRGQVESQTILGQVFYHGGADWDPDYKTAMTYFKSAAKQGGSVAQGYLGQMYLKGEGVKEDTHLAYKYFKASAEGGSAMGLNGMGLCYWRGIEVVQDYDEAWAFFDKAIAKEHPDALYNVAMMLKEWNQPLLADSITSYLIKAVKNGHLQAHYELAKTYHRQPGFCALSVYLLKTFVEKGDQTYILDEAHAIYKRGKTNQAVSRYLFMAGQGFEVAQSNLAKLLQPRTQYF
jgi:SEL1 protein